MHKTKTTTFSKKKWLKDMRTKKMVKTTKTKTRITTKTTIPQTTPPMTSPSTPKMTPLSTSLMTSPMSMITTVHTFKKTLPTFEITFLTIKTTTTTKFPYYINVTTLTTRTSVVVRYLVAFSKTMDEILLGSFLYYVCIFYVLFWTSQPPIFFN